MKYVGSKQRFSKQIYNKICEISPRNNRPWVEPFAGGMNMIANIPFEDGPRYANDINEYVIDMFIALTKGWVPPDIITEEIYTKIKNNKNAYPKYLVGFVGIGCSYSGKWFGGYARGNNKNKIRNYCLESKNNVLKQIQKLKDVYYCSSEYFNIIIPENSIVYCDPPYANTVKYKDDFNTTYFWDWVRKISKHYDVFISEYKAPEDFDCILEIETFNTLDKNTGSKKGIEKLFKIRKHV